MIRVCFSEIVTEIDILVLKRFEGDLYFITFLGKCRQGKEQ